MGVFGRQEGTLLFNLPLAILPQPGRLWLDIDDQEALKWGSSCIRWADGHLTKSGKLCRRD